MPSSPASSGEKVDRTGGLIPRTGSGSYFPLEDDGYETVAFCATNKRERRPTAMTNIINKFVKVVNNESVVQKIITEECQ